MSEILIKGMKFPKNRYGAHIIIKPNGDVQDYLNGAIFAKAIKLPEHEELIDRQALINVAEDWMASHTAIFTFRDFLRLIDNVPTIVEANNV